MRSFLFLPVSSKYQKSNECNISGRTLRRECGKDCALNNQRRILSAVHRVLHDFRKRPLACVFFSIKEEAREIA